MSAQSILSASAHAEKGLVGAVLIGAGILLLCALLRPGKRETDCETLLAGRRELAWLAVILVSALLTRTVGWDPPLNAPFSFSAMTPLYIAKLLDGGRLWQQWVHQLTNYQAASIEKSALVLPVAAAFQAVVGPSFHLPVLLGAFFSVTAVLFAWLLGRAAVSKSFGLVFAALVAASPLQLVWSRLGGIHITSVTHVLFTLWCGYVAGKRRSWPMAILTGLAIWSSVYHYYAARVAMPLGFAFLVAGLRRSRAPLGRSLALLLLASLALAAVYAAARPPSLMKALWPEYRGYVGNKGEQTLGDLVRQNVDPVTAEVPTALRRYFRADRATWELSQLTIRWGTQFGGLCFAPIGLLGLLGLAHALGRPRQEWPWLLLAAAGLALPVLSVSTARRFLVFDVAWCALAAQGLLVLLHSWLFRGVRARVAFGIAAVSLALLAGWSFASVAVLNRILSPRHWQQIPFGESGFGDGLTCMRCLRAGYEWRDEIAGDRFVVLFDTDLERENPTSPGGLPLYGRLAALNAGRPGNFLEFYPVMRDFDVGPPDVGPYFNAATTDFAAYLIARLEAARPAKILWHFERPTQWERWLASRLVQAGGRLSEFETPLSSTPGMQVRTDWSEHERVFQLLRELARSNQHEDPGCPAIEPLGRVQYPFPVYHLAAGDGATEGQPPDWVSGSWFKVAYRDAIVDNDLPMGTGVEPAGGSDSGRLHVLGRSSNLTVHELGTRKKTSQVISLPAAGLNCAVRIGMHWWEVDSTTGGVATTDPQGGWVPREHWVGIARDWADRLVLASGEQSLAVFDLGVRREIRRFPAAVWPSRRILAGECSPVVAGTGWYATLNHLMSLLTVYDEEGREVGRRDLAEVLGLGRGSNWITALAAGGPYLAIGYNTTVTTTKVDFAPDCPDRSRGPDGK